MDNCSIHHTDRVQQLLDNAGIILIYLPPYRPDLNPIESAFGFVKSYLKQHDDVVDAFPNIIPLVKSGFDSISPEICQAWINQPKCYS